MKFITAMLIAYAKRDPYLHLDGYMERYWVLRPRPWFPVGIRVHRILRSDNDRHLHCHPWDNISILLQGSYTEIVPADQQQHPRLDQLRSHLTYHIRRPWRPVFRFAGDRHRLQLRAPVWSLFIMLGRKRRWGFHTPDGWVYWREYLNQWGGEYEG